MADKKPNTNKANTNKAATNTQPTSKEIPVHEFSDKDIDFIYRKLKVTQKEQDDINKASNS